MKEECKFANNRFESEALLEMANRFRLRPRKFDLRRSENHLAEDDIGYVSRSSSEEFDGKRRSIGDTRDMATDNMFDIIVIHLHFLRLQKFFFYFSIKSLR